MKINQKIIVVLLFSFVFGVIQIASAANYPAYGWAWSSNTGWLKVNPVIYVPPPPPSTIQPGGTATNTVSPSPTSSISPSPGGSTVSPTSIAPVTKSQNDNFKLWKEAYAQSATWTPLTIREDGTVFGWGWSGLDQIGWVSFNPGDTADCGEHMNVNMVNGEVNGWYKYLAGNQENDGWDGCAITSGPLHLSPMLSGTKGVTVDFQNDRIVGYSWGNEVVGWTKFYSSLFPTFSVIIPNINPSNSSQLRVTCSVRSAANSSEFTAGVFNGTAPYKIEWNLDANDEITRFGSGITVTRTDSAPLSHRIIVGPFINEHVFSSAEGTKIGVKVTDATNRTVTNYCPDTTIKGSLTKAKLMIGSASQMSAVSSDDLEDCPALDCLYKRYTIKQGGKFTLKWNQTQKYNASTHQYFYDVCHRTLKLANGSISTEFPWAGATNAGPGSVEITDTGSPANEGRYVFEMKCGTAPSSIVQLDVVSSDIIEI